MSEAGNTIYHCQMALIEELKKVTENMRFPNPKSDELIPIKVYGQRLPIPTKDLSEFSEDTNTETTDFIGDQIEDPILDCPWIKTMVASGDIEGPDKFHRVQFAIVIGVFDDRSDNAGSGDFINIVDVIKDRFIQNPLLDNQYNNPGIFHWEIENDQDTFPFTYGALVTYFDIRTPRRLSEYT